MTTDVLHLAPNLDLPLDFATEGLVVIGVRGSGKSNTEVRFAELLFGAGIPFAAVDPKGDWYGMRMDGPGGPGLPVPVFGGLFGDFPLDASLGVTIADLLVDENISAVLDVSRMSHQARAKFLTAFFRQLMERHQLEPHVRTVIFEEAHRYIPQNVKGDQAALKEAASSILLEGRSFGLGCWACTQRPARLHNDVLEEVDTAIIHRIGVTATADLKRVREWVKHEDLGAEIGASLTKLGAGDAWVLSPVSLGIVGRFQMDRRATFDSGATPVVGGGALVRRQATMADIDAAAIKEALSDAIANAKENDPNELKRRLAAAEARVAELEMWEPPPPPAPVVVAIPARLVELRDELVGGLGAVVRTMDAMCTEVDRHLADLDEAASVEAPKPEPPTIPTTSTGAGMALDVTFQQKASAQVAKPRGLRAVPDAGKAPNAASAQGKILAVLARAYPGSVPQRRAGFLAGYSSRKTTVRNAVTLLRKQGLVEGDTAGLRATEAGMAAGIVEPLPTGPELLAHWRNELGTGTMRDVFEIMFAAWPEPLSDAEVCAALDIDPTKSTVRNCKTQLRAQGLLDGHKIDDDLARSVGLSG